MDRGETTTRASNHGERVPPSEVNDKPGEETTQSHRKRVAWVRGLSRGVDLGRGLTSAGQNLGRHPVGSPKLGMMTRNKRRSSGRASRVPGPASNHHHLLGRRRACEVAPGIECSARPSIPRSQSGVLPDRQARNVSHTCCHLDPTILHVSRAHGFCSALLARPRGMGLHRPSPSHFRDLRIGRC